MYHGGRCGVESAMSSAGDPGCRATGVLATRCSPIKAWASWYSQHQVLYVRLGLSITDPKTLENEQLIWICTGACRTQQFTTRLHHPSHWDSTCRCDVIVFCSYSVCEHRSRYGAERACKGSSETSQERSGESKDTRSMSSIRALCKIRTVRST
jgi:hypothetical protein